MKNVSLFDASSLIHAIKIGQLSLIYNNYVQWLTIYEIINAIWKEANITKSISAEEATKIVEIISDALRFTKILTPQQQEKQILTIATTLKITAYDASYIALAKKHNLTLITEDKQLKTKAEKLIQTKTISELIKSK